MSFTKLPADTGRQERGHDLLLANFPSISSHIRIGNEVRTDFHKIQSVLSQLEREIDPADAEVSWPDAMALTIADIVCVQTSFLPPLLSLLSRHFQAVESQARAQIHAAALRTLRAQTERLEKLEEAVYAGRGADEWVINELEGGQGALGASEGHQMLKDTRAMRAAEVSRV